MAETLDEIDFDSMFKDIMGTKKKVDLNVLD